MAKYHSWTLGDIEALINILGGDETARGIKNREIRFTLEMEPSKPAPRPPLVGKVVKTIVIPAYEASSFAEAVRLGEFDNDTTEIVCKFAEEHVALAKATKVELVEFNRDWWQDEVLAWGVENGSKKPIGTAHIMGIGIKLPNEQHEHPIVELGSVQGGLVLYLYGASDWRGLNHRTAEGKWNRRCLVGFLSE